MPIGTQKYCEWIENSWLASDHVTAFEFRDSKEQSDEQLFRRVKLSYLDGLSTPYIRALGVKEDLSSLGDDRDHDNVVDEAAEYSPPHLSEKHDAWRNLNYGFVSMGFSRRRAALRSRYCPILRSPAKLISVAITS